MKQYSIISQKGTTYYIDRNQQSTQVEYYLFPSLNFNT